MRRTDSRQIGGRTIQLPMVDVHTVGAGGGSIGWRDRGGALRVGPRSAGAEPGPACYGRGGTEPTVTDANLLLGYLAADSTPGRRRRARRRRGRARAVGALAELARPRASWRPPRGSCGSPTRRWCGRCAWSRSSAASTRAASPCCPSAAPARCTRRRSPPSSGIERDPLPARRRRALGARPLRLRPPPRHRPHGDAERRRPQRRAGRRRGRRADRRRLATASTGAEPEVVYEMRYAGQAFELPVPGPTRPRPRRPRRALRAGPRGALRPPRPRGRGRARPHPPGAGRARARAAARAPPTAGGSRESAAPVRFDGEWVETPVLRGEPAGRPRAPRARSSSSCPRRPSSLPAGLATPRSTRPGTIRAP